MKTCSLRAAGRQELSHSRRLTPAFEPRRSVRDAPRGEDVHVKTQRSREERAQSSEGLGGGMGDDKRSEGKCIEACFSCIASFSVLSRTKHGASQP